MKYIVGTDDQRRNALVEKVLERDDRIDELEAELETLRARAARDEARVRAYANLHAIAAAGASTGRWHGLDAALRELDEVLDADALVAELVARRESNGKPLTAATVDRMVDPDWVGLSCQGCGTGGVMRPDQDPVDNLGRPFTYHGARMQWLCHDCACDHVWEVGRDDCSLCGMSFISYNNPNPHE